MDFYVLLGIEPGASLNDIKRAYRRLARRYHPDINPGDRMAAAQFRQIVEAYETLSDPDRRQRYDTGTTPSADPRAGSVGFQGFDFSVSVGGPSASTFGDLFAEIFQQRDLTHDEGRAEHGADLHHSITLGFEEAMRGGQQQLTVTRQEHCRACKGMGRLRAAATPCARCAGTGAIQSARGHMVFSRPCPECRGAGMQADVRCPACGGQQTLLRTEAVIINVPAGLADGARIRLPNRGHAGRFGGEPGDLMITVHVEPHPLFRREGDDLHFVVPIAIHEAALGAKVEVPSFDGPARLRVPPGTQSGQRFRLRERGAPSARDGRRGDLVVEVKLALPKILDERSKALLREFGQINATDEVRRHLHHFRGPAEDDPSKAD
jgi:molecular chaperone DnaJ